MPNRDRSRFGNEKGDRLLAGDGDRLLAGNGDLLLAGNGDRFWEIAGRSPAERDGLLGNSRAIALCGTIMGRKLTPC